VTSIGEVPGSHDAAEPCADDNNLVRLFQTVIPSKHHCSWRGRYSILLRRAGSASLRGSGAAQHWLDHQLLSRGLVNFPRADLLGLAPGHGC
jgi:hypothetical protein